jgi:hypothetical protein
VNPVVTPETFPALSFSSRVRACATSTVNSGIVAFRIEARLPVISVCAQTIRLKGITLLIAPMNSNASQTFGDPGIDSPLSRTITHSTIAASPTRPRTTVNGPKPSSATSTKKNDPPQSTDRETRSSHSRAPMDLAMRAPIHKTKQACMVLMLRIHGSGARPGSCEGVTACKKDAGGKSKAPA